MTIDSDYNDVNVALAFFMSNFKYISLNAVFVVVNNAANSQWEYSATLSVHQLSLSLKYRDNE